MEKLLPVLALAFTLPAFASEPGQPLDSDILRATAKPDLFLKIRGCKQVEVLEVAPLSAFPDIAPFEAPKE